MTSRILSRRLLHTTGHPRARLINSSISVSPEHAFTSLPPPPIPPRIDTTSPPRPPRHSSQKGSQTSHQVDSQSVSQAQRPETAHRADGRVGLTDDKHPTRPLSSRPAEPAHEATDRAAHESAQDRASAAAFDVFLIRTLAQLAEQRRAEVGQPGPVDPLQPAAKPLPAWVSLPDLVNQKRNRDGHVVDSVSLAYEPTPTPSRRLRLDGRPGVQQEAFATSASGMEEQDGIVIVAHVLGGPSPRVSVCSGFAVGSSFGDGSQAILTCAHTLDSRFAAKQIERHLSPAESSAAPSATFVLAPSGHVYTVQELLSSVSEADLLLLRLSPDPINPSALPVRPLRTLPINPYPASISTEVSVHRYLNPLSRLRRKLQRLPEREWEEGTVREYKDPIGCTAEPGTYDALHTMLFSCAPASGSSGGPVIDKATGSVVGVTRGSTHKYGERQQYGFATPAERIFEMFRLPGFKTTAERDADRVARSNGAPNDTSSSSAPTRSREGDGRTK